MSGQQYLEEFKIEAVKRVTEKSHSVADFVPFVEFILQMILDTIVAASVTVQVSD